MIPPVAGRALLLASVLGLAVACASAARNPAGPPDDLAISTAVRTALQEDDRIDAESIAVEARDGVVILSGVVGSLDEARRAIRRASRVRGVQQVVNRLRVVARP